MRGNRIFPVMALGMFVFAGAAYAQQPAVSPLPDGTIRVGTASATSPTVTLESVARQVAPGLYEVDPASVQGMRIIVKEDGVRRITVNEEGVRRITVQEEGVRRTTTNEPGLPARPDAPNQRAARDITIEEEGIRTRGAVTLCFGIVQPLTNHCTGILVTLDL